MIGLQISYLVLVAEVFVSTNYQTFSVQAVEHCIDRLKAIAPIWKKEVYSEGEGQWKANKECTWAPTPPQGC